MSGNGTYLAAQHAATALLAGADPADIVRDPTTYGAWAALIQNLATLYADGGTPAVIRGFDALARAHRHVASLVAGTPPAPASTSPAVPPLPTPATEVYTHLAPCAHWLDAYITFACQAAPMSPLSFHEAAGLYAVSVTVARRLALRVGTDAIYPNLFFSSLPHQRCTSNRPVSRSSGACSRLPIWHTCCCRSG
jgi:hypothetical protein